MDFDRLFQLFKSSSDEQIEERSREVEEKLLSDPFLRIGLIVRGVQNYNMLLTILQFKYGDQLTQDKKKHIKEVHYNRLYSLLEEFKSEFTEEDLKKAAEYFTFEEIKHTFQSLLYFFEKKEEYLKCMEILKVQELLQEYTQPQQKIP